MNTEGHKLAGQATDVAGAASGVDALIHILQPLGPECAEVFSRVRLYGRSVASVALKMRISVDTARSCLTRADLHFMELVEKDRKKRSLGPRHARFSRQGKRKKVDEALRQKALGWFNALETPEDIHARCSQFGAWLEQSAEHGEAYHRVEEALREATLFGNLMRAQGVDEEVLVAIILLQFMPPLRRSVLPVGLSLAVTAAS